MIAPQKEDEDDTGAPEVALHGSHLKVLPGAVGRQLQAAYNELVRAPIPDKFLELLSRLEERQQTEGDSAGTPPQAKTGAVETGAVDADQAAGGGGMQLTGGDEEKSP